MAIFASFAEQERFINPFTVQNLYIDVKVKITFYNSGAFILYKTQILESKHY